ncbi:hypothetical protein [Dokdonella sp.]|uniref:hypothetical protein n=1 Tax=Dokdonella sp. TaxID=2291710 RepID=UPI0035278816
MKLCHTLIWIVLSGCVISIPVLAYQQRLGMASFMIAVILVETLVLATNGWRCPLTNVAERYTDNREPNFDIYLPRWLARYNKQIFGTWFVLGSLYTLAQWLGS